MTAFIGYCDSMGFILWKCVILTLQILMTAFIGYCDGLNARHGVARTAVVFSIATEFWEMEMKRGIVSGVHTMISISRLLE